MKTNLLLASCVVFILSFLNQTYARFRIKTKEKKLSVMA
jgi:hypothetical protein